ncbi:hypothetical protein DL96DRAFT_1710902 [Flagelloscypha sp. PMI_526]|nr:hypothetical protein DL96DRAFT_1710902 [Flagelloscypha sp. PMI_526]
MPSIPFDLYPLILENLPLEALKQCSLTNRALHELALPLLFHSVTLRSDYLNPLLDQLNFFIGGNTTPIARFVREVHLNIYAFVSSTPAAFEYQTFFHLIASQLAVLDIGGRKIRWAIGWSPSPKDWEICKDLLVDLVTLATSLESIIVGEGCPIPLAELVALCPSLCSITLIDPDTPLLHESSHWKHGLIRKSPQNLRNLTIRWAEHWDRPSALSVLTLVGQSINSADSGASSAFRSLFLHGFDWLAKEGVIQIVDLLFSPLSLFDNLREIQLPPVLFRSMDATCSLSSLPSLPTLKIITFTIGAMTEYTTQQWPVFFEWILQVISATPSLEKLAFEIAYNDYVSDRKLTMLIAVLEGKIDVLPELNFVLVAKGIDPAAAVSSEELTEWLRSKLPTLSASGKLKMTSKWERQVAGSFGDLMRSLSLTVKMGLEVLTVDSRRAKKSPILAQC